MTVHDFRTDLAYSHSMESAPWWDAVYRKAFGDNIAGYTTHPTSMRHQLAGIDRIITFTNGHTVHIDEKVRRKDYGDMLVEIWSVSYDDPDKMHRNKCGWALKDSHTDYIAYAIEPTQTCHLLPVPALRAATTANLLEWARLASSRTDGFRYANAQNRGYTTINIAMPTQVLLDAIAKSLTVTWND